MAETYLMLVRVGRGGRLHIAADGDFTLTLCGMYGKTVGRGRVTQDTICKRCFAASEPREEKT